MSKTDTTSAANGQILNGFNANTLLDQMASTMMMSQMMKMGDQSEGLTTQTVFNMLVLFSINEVKEMLRFGITGTKQFIKDNRQNAWNYLILFLQFLHQSLRQLIGAFSLGYFSSKTEYDEQESDESVDEIEMVEECFGDNMVQFEMKITNPILQLLLDEAKRQNDHLRIKKQVGLDFESLDQSNVKLSYDGFNLQVPDLGHVSCHTSLEVEYRSNRDSNEFAFSTTQEKISEKNVAKDFISLIPDENLRQKFRSMYEWRKASYPFMSTSPGTVWNHCQGQMTSITTTNMNLSVYLYKILTTTGYVKPKTIQEESDLLSQIVLFGTCFYQNGIKTSSGWLTEFKKNVSKSRLVFPELNLNLPIDEDKIKGCVALSQYIHSTRFYEGNLTEKMKNYLDFTHISNVIFGKNRALSTVSLNDKKSDNKKPMNKQTIRVTLDSDSLMPIDDVSFRFQEYINRLIELKKKSHTQKKNIYLLQAKYDVKTNERVNPEHTRYLQTRNSLQKKINEMRESFGQKDRKEESTEKKSSDDSEIETFSNSRSQSMDHYSMRSLYQELNSLVEPPEKITEEEFNLRIVKKKIRSFRKPLETLYLREKDSRRVRKILEAFENRDEVFERLGIPKKLGILAHGVPGTGKSTTIQAIATYLKLDIYYLDLNGITKNEELKAMFDYVMTQNLGGGMIVFEDIDAMTNIVHRRDEEEFEMTMADLDEEELSLSYLLNLLDGTLCAENTVYAMTTNHKEKLDPALYRKGRIDVDIDFKLCDRYQFQSIYHQMMDRELPIELLSRLKEDRYTPADFIFHLLEYVYDPEESDEEIIRPFLETDQGELVRQQDRQRNDKDKEKDKEGTDTTGIFVTRSSVEIIEQIMKEEELIQISSEDESDREKEVTNVLVNV